MSSEPKDDVQRIAARASEWLERLSEDPNLEGRAAFAAWVAESPLHVREFLNMAAIDRLLEHVDPQQRLSVAHSQYTPADNVIRLIGSVDRDATSAKMDLAARPEVSNPDPIGRAARGNGGRSVYRWATGVSVLAAALTLVWWDYSVGWREYKTAIGEQGTVQLADRSVVSLNTGSRLKVRITANARTIRLLEGEALFKVHHDATRPFRVYAGAGVIEAVGTEFDVLRRLDGETRVAVIEGKVQITPARMPAPNVTSSASEDQTRSTAVNAPQVSRLPRLSASEEARIGVDGRIRTRKGIDLADVTAWRSRRLVFHGATLEEIAAEFNRYNEHRRIKVQGRARERRYTMVLPADDADSLIEYLRQSGDVSLDVGDGGVVIRARGE